MLLALAPSGAWAASCSGSIPSGSNTVHMVVGTTHRTAVVHVPPGLSSASSVPLVLVLHGAGGTGAKMEHYTRFSSLADQKRFVAAYPSADGAFWNTNAVPGKPDDFAFLGALIKYVEGGGCVDRARVFATGVSNGGGMAAATACRMSAQISAVAPVAAATDDQRSCHPRHPVSILEIAGTADPTVPYYGRARRRTRDGLPPFVRAWVERDGCPGSARVRSIAPRTMLFEWQGCASGVRVEHIRIRGGRHQWPGARPPDPGPQSTICASCRIWTFFGGLDTPVRQWSSSGGAGV